MELLTMKTAIGAPSKHWRAGRRVSSGDSSTKPRWRWKKKRNKRKSSEMKHTHTHTQKKNKSKTINVTKRSEDENGVSRGKKKCSFFLLKKNREKESDRTWIVGRAVHFPSFSPRVAIVKMFFFLRIFCRFSFQLKSDLNKFTWPSSGSQRVLALDFDLSLALGRAISFPPFPTWP